MLKKLSLAAALALLAAGALSTTTVTPPGDSVEPAERFARCAATALKVKQLTNVIGEQTDYGTLYHQHLRNALAFEDAAHLLPRLEKATAALAQQYEKTQRGDDISALRGTLNKECALAEETYSNRIEATHKANPPKADAVAPAERGKTMPVEILGALGAPILFDYNPNGLFVLKYGTPLTFELYLFDPQAKLILKNSVCRVEKDKCPAPK